jgi:hypothetical protein
MTTHLPARTPHLPRPALPRALSRTRRARERQPAPVPPATDADGADGAGGAAPAVSEATGLPEVVEHDTASLGAVVVAGLILVGLVVGVALIASQLLDVVAWAMRG